MRTGPSRLLPSMPWLTTRVPNVGTTPVRLAIESPNRAGITFALGTQIAVVGSYLWRIKPGSAPSDGDGYILDPSNPLLEFFFRDYGPAISSSWWGVPVFSGPPVATAVCVYQFQFDPIIGREG